MNIAPFPGASSGAGGHGLLRDAACATGGSSPFLAPPAAAAVPVPNKRKRRPAGTPDPDAEVVALSPKTLMESDRYVCEICNQGFQRDQNLQMHRRRHKVPWKLLKRSNLATTKRVYICPERSCLHHDPAHALGDLVGIKKHYRRKHCTEKQWQCEKCSKGYAVQSDYKAHLKTCGTRGHSCDCGRVFSRVESFIEHQDTCSAVKRRSVQSGGESERVSHRDTDTRTSNESPSQSSDTTQAMSFTQSGMSERSVDELNSTKARILDEHARRIQEAAAATTSSPMPAWLTDAHSSGTTHLLPQADNRHVSNMYNGSRSQITRCSSDSAAYPEVVSCPEMTMVLQPSLQLSIGPAGVEVASSSPCTDIKPSFGNSMVLDTIASSGPTTVGLNDALARLVGPTSSGMERGNFLTALSPVESSARIQSSKPKHENIRTSRTETVAYYNPTGNTSSYLEHWAAGDSVHHESGADPALGARGLHHAQLEPTSSSVMTDYRQGLHMDVAEPEHLFGARSVSNDQFAFRSQMAAAARATPADQKREADVHPARVGLARQECDEAERELARAETLKREAREQLQVAAAEKNYAKRAREAAKRQVEISEAELASAQRLRAHALAELQKASSPSSFCHSCKSALELTTTSPPSRRSTSTSPTSWSMMAPYSPSTQHQTSKAHHMLTNPGINRMSWSAFQQPDRKFDQIAPQDLDLNKIS